MTQYETKENGKLSGGGYSSIPVGHRLYVLAQSDSNAQILPYVQPVIPPPTIQQQIDALDSMITKRNLWSAQLGDQFAIDHIQAIENQLIPLRDLRDQLE
jgi:hypothetical protein